MQIIFNLLSIGVFFYLILSNIGNTTDSDVSNLYASRDRLWKELFNLQQTSKRRDHVLRNRIHNLERKINGITRGKSETQQASSS